MTILAQDDFSDSNGTNIDGKALDTGGNWDVITGAGEVQTGALEQTSATFTDFSAIVDADLATDGTATIEFFSEPNGFSSFGVIFRYVDSDNYWMSTANVGEDELRIYEKTTALGQVERASVAWSGSEYTDYTMVVAVSGTSVTVTIGSDDVSYGSMGTHLTAQKWGVYTNIDGNRINSFLVESAAATGAAKLADSILTSPGIINGALVQ